MMLIILKRKVWGQKEADMLYRRRGLDLHCILMFSRKYHCHVRSSPVMIVFSSMDIWRHDVDAPGFCKSILNASLSENRCVRIFPGLSDEVTCRKQW